jgi:hypothetical protein
MFISTVVVADVPIADVIAPDDQDVGFLSRINCRSKQTQAHHGQSKRFP